MPEAARFSGSDSLFRRQYGRTRASTGAEIAENIRLKGFICPATREGEHMTQAELFRDEGIQRVTDHNLSWMDRALEFIPNLYGRHLTGEDIRRLISDEIGYPNHHNAWGAMIRHAIRLELLKPTGKWRKMLAPRSHARQTPEYEVLR